MRLCKVEHAVQRGARPRIVASDEQLGRVRGEHAGHARHVRQWPHEPLLGTCEHHVCEPARRVPSPRLQAVLRKEEHEAVGGIWGVCIDVAFDEADRVHHMAHRTDFAQRALQHERW